MQPDRRYWAGKRVCVTGGTGFLGWNLASQLLPLAGHVRILGLRPASPELNELLRQVDCVFGDVRDPEAVRRAMADCDVVFHTAGTVAAWGPGLAHIHSVHVDGTRQVLQGLPAHARLVHTSSMVTIAAAPDRRLLTETEPFNLQRLKVNYVHAKKAAEDLALAAAAAGTNVVVVNPSFLIGPNDYEGSAMGRFCLRVWKGRVPLAPPKGWNLVDVRDAALGHLLAAERGQSGRRYFLGGDNLTQVDFITRLSRLNGRRPPWSIALPYWLYATVARIAEMRSFIVKREPYPALQFARMSRHYWYFCSARAMAELGYQPRSIDESLLDAYEWFQAQKGNAAFLTADQQANSGKRGKAA